MVLAIVQQWQVQTLFSVQNLDHTETGFWASTVVRILDTNLYSKILNPDVWNTNLSEIQTFVCLVFRHISGLKYEQKCPDFIHILTKNLSETQTV